MIIAKQAAPTDLEALTVIHQEIRAEIGRPCSIDMSDAISRTILEKIEAAGYALVPIEPTPDMKLAGSDANLENIWIPVPDSPEYQYRMRKHEVHAFSEAEAAECWRAMVGARPR